MVDTELREFLRERFDGIDGRLDGIDGRLDAIDGRLDGIDGRLDAIERRLDTAERRLDVVEHRLDVLGERFATFDQKFEAHRKDLRLHFDVSVDGFRGEVRLIAEQHGALSRRIDELRADFRFEQQETRAMLRALRPA